MSSSLPGSTSASNVRQQPSTSVDASEPAAVTTPAKCSEMDALLLGRTKELVAAGPDQKNWRGIGIALLVIIIVCALIVAAIVLLTPADKGVTSKKSRISLEEVVKGQFSYRRFNGSWISDNEFLFRDPYGAIGIYDARNKSELVLMPNATLRQHTITNYFVSADYQYILLYHDYERIFRYTFKTMLLLYNVSGDHITPLLPHKSTMWFQYAAWGPTGTQLVYVYENNIYYLSDITAEPQQITSTGVEGVIYNGVPDWVYEEEILTSSSALWWSPDGKKLCFASFNDTDVDVLQYPYYGSYTKINNVYPELLNLRYPKAGKKNPTVTIYIADLTSNKDVIAVQPPKDYNHTDYYFTDVQWIDKSVISITWLKRSQNTSVISLCRESNRWACITNLQIDNNGHGWVDVSKAAFSPDAQTYFLKLSGPPEGGLGRFKHIAAVDVLTGSKKFLTSGKYDTVAVLGYNLAKKTLYYMTTLEEKPGERHIFAVIDVTQKGPKNLTCLTCDIGPDCLYNDATFSPGFTYYILECLGPGIPRIELRLTETNEVVSVLDSNDELRDLVETKAMPKIKNLKVPIDGGYHANVRLYLPPILQEYEITKYPMLVEVYGGPGSQMVTEKFNVNWGTFLASGKNVIYARIDGRGSGFQGDKFLHELYLKLGTVEVIDQLAVTSYLKQKLPFVDGKHIAIFGWSYGGYVSALALSSEEKVFSCGISVAPVTSWLYYDSVYSERYMKMPTKEDNLINYENSNVMKKALHFKDKKYLLIHGTADDNVHWQQSMMLAKSLTDAGVLFRMQVYPDENHGLGHVKYHLYQTMNGFLDYCFSDKYKDETSYHSTSQDSER